MKKLFSIVLIVSLLLTLLLVALAETLTDAGSVSQGLTVNVTYADEAEASIYVDVDWDDTSFAYEAGSHGTWNPQTHQYEGGTDGGWTDDTATVTVTNHSNVPVYITTQLVAEASDYGVSVEVDNEAFYLDAWNGSADSAQITVTVSGTLDVNAMDGAGSFTLGTLTVNVASAQ